MKIAVVKLGARVSYSSQGTSGGTGEAISIINMLKSHADVTVFTKILKKDKNPDDVTFVDIEDDCNTANFDALVVINGSVNFFGGAEDWHQIMNYKIINIYEFVQVFRRRYLKGKKVSIKKVNTQFFK